MNEPHMPPARRRDRLYTAITLTLGVLLLPAAFLRHPCRARELACAWALRLRFPAEDLTGLSPGTLTALTAARTEAFWRDHQLIGVTIPARSLGHPPSEVTHGRLLRAGPDQDHAVIAGVAGVRVERQRGQPVVSDDEHGAGRIRLPADAGQRRRYPFGHRHSPQLRPIRLTPFRRWLRLLQPLGVSHAASHAFLPDRRASSFALGE